MDPSVHLGMLDCDGYSLGGRVLDEVTNGDRIVLEKLDSYVSTTQDDLDSEDFAVIIDHKGLINNDPKGFTFLKDLLQTPREITFKILSHPVITTYIKKRWPKMEIHLHICCIPLLCHHLHLLPFDALCY